MNTTASATPPAATPPTGVALVLRAVVLIVAAAVPVVLALLLAGPTAAIALYLGLVLGTTFVLALPRRQQWIAAGWVAVVAAAGALVGPQPGPLAGAVVVCALVQAMFLHMDARAVAVAPALMVFYANSVPQGSAVVVGISGFIGAAYLVGAAALTKLVPTPRPLPWPRALVHAALLALGCGALVLIGAAMGQERLHWGPLAFCLAFVPGPGTARSAVRYAMATAVGSAVAVIVGLLAPPWLVIALIVVGAVTVVASTLAGRHAVAVASIALTVILVGTISPGAMAHALGWERFGSALLAVGIGLVLLLAAEPLERLLTRLAGAASEGSAPWTR